MNRSHKLELERLKDKNEYTQEDLEIANDLLKQEDPPFHEEVREVIRKITEIINNRNLK